MNTASKPFDARTSRLNTTRAGGHLARTGHKLTGYYVTEPQSPEHYPVSRLVLTCPCGNSPEDRKEQP